MIEIPEFDLSTAAYSDDGCVCHYYTAETMHDYAARVCAGNDAEIARLRELLDEAATSIDLWIKRVVSDHGLAPEHAYVAMIKARAVLEETK